MSIVITKGKVAAVNAKLALSNKGQTLPDNPSHEEPLSTPVGFGSPCAPTPFIDKISVVLDPPSQWRALNIHSLIKALPNDTPPADASKGKQFLPAGSKAKWGQYKWAKRIILPSVLDVKKYPLLQCAYTAKQITQLRIEFVPVDLGKVGMDELHMTLSDLVPGGWSYFVEHGRVTRIDVAADFPEVLMDDFHFLPIQGATTRQWRVNGKLQTYTHGKPKGNHTAIYDRKDKRIAKQKSWENKQGMRIERRIKTLPIEKLTELPSLPNPFLGMNLVSMPEAPPSEQTKMLYVWKLFHRAADAQGLTAALALLPEEKRTLYRKHLNAHVQPWWNPKAIWANWPNMLDELKIASPTAWK
jgi:hypothetical protein